MGPPTIKRRSSLSFSIGTTLLAISYVAALVAGLKTPNQVYIFFLVTSLSGLLGLAWFRVAQGWPMHDSWLLVFSISATWFHINRVHLPSEWHTQLFELFHADISSDDINVTRIRFATLVVFGSFPIFAFIISFCIQLVMPKRIAPLYLIGVIATVIGILFFPGGVATFIGSLLVDMTIIVSWLVLIKTWQTTNRWLLCFALMTSSMLLLPEKFLVLPTELSDFIYGFIHAPPPNVNDAITERYFFKSALELCLVPFLGIVSATLVTFTIHASSRRKVTEKSELIANDR